jgi:hypothetical protein
MLSQDTLAATRLPATSVARRLLQSNLLAGATACLLGVAATYFLAVWTKAGQDFEDTARAGAARHAATSWYSDADHWLEHFTSGTFLLAVVVIGAVGLLRRRWAMALCGVATALAATLAARFLRDALPVRPALGSVAAAAHGHQPNTFPSGHAAAAMGLFFGTLIVVSRRWYPAVTVLGLPGAVGAGAATVAADWHRASDTIGADLLALAAGLAGLALAARLGLVAPTIRPNGGTQRAVKVVVAGLATVATAIGVALYLRYHGAYATDAEARYAYWSAQSFALGTGLGAAAVMLGICHSLAAAPRRAKTLK